MDKQYDLSPEMQRLYELKQKQRADAKQFYRNLLNNPYRKLEALPFDPALMRFNAAHSYRIEYLKPTPKYFFRVLLFSLPIGIAYYAFSSKHEEKERRYRSGAEKYEDRLYLFQF